MIKAHLRVDLVLPLADARSELALNLKVSQDNISPL
jgi:hypothetical protein